MRCKHLRVVDAGNPEIPQVPCAVKEACRQRPDCVVQQR